MECPHCEAPNVDHARFCAKCGALLPAAPSDADDPMIGQVIKNTFRVLRLLGEGGMGRVYEGEQQMGTTTRKVAIKTLHPHLSQDPQIVARFNRECGTVAELEHPNTIQFFDFGQGPDGALFIAMEFLEGKSVSALLERDGPMPAARVDHILRQVCGSLNEAHKKGIVHRDLKPENVQLGTRAGEADFVKVLDFGIAARREGTDPKKEQKLTQQGTVLGTPPYMSPEQFTGKELDARSDIYSLGVMAYEMLTGKLPFDADTPWEWATKHLTEQPYPFEVTTPQTTIIPDPMKVAIMRALKKNRDERQANVMQFYQEIAGKGVTTGDMVAHAGTAAMNAPPPGLFQKGATQMGAPAFTPPQGHPSPTANEMVVPVPQPYPAQPGYPPPRAGGGGGGNKGIIIALVALLGVGGLVGTVLAIRSVASNSSGGNDSLDLGTIASGGVATLEPEGTAPPTPDAADTTVAVDTTPPKPTVAPTKTGTPAKTAATPTTTAPPAGGPKGEEACQKSAQLARQRQIESAVALYRACRQGGQTSHLAHQAISSNAGPAAQQARFRGDCAAAKRIASSAGSIGAAGSSQAEASKCK